MLENIGNDYKIDDEAFLEKDAETGEVKERKETIKITTWDNRKEEGIQTV